MTGRTLFNLNQYLVFRTTDEGEEHLRSYAHETAQTLIRETKGRFSPTSETYLPRRTDDGRWMMQAWHFMQVFGPQFHLGGPPLIEDGEVEVIGFSDVSGY